MNQCSVTYYGVNKPYELYYRNEATDYPVGVHMHNVMEIYFTLTDLPNVLLDDVVMSVKKGSIIFIHPFCAHQLYHQKNVVFERYILNIDLRWLDNVMAYNKDSLNFLRSGDKFLIYHLEEEKQVRIERELKSFLPIQEKNDVGGLSVFFSLLSVLDDVVACFQNDKNKIGAAISKEQKRINDIISYINKHLSEGITLAEIADYFYLNKDYLARIFMKHAHISIGQYMIIQKISKAQDMLREGRTVTEVQEKLGYSSYAYFFNSFKKATGISPSKYRNQYIRGQDNPPPLGGGSKPACITGSSDIRLS